MLEILLPAMSAILNRMRGSGMPKWLWFVTMSTLPLWLGHDYGFCLLWLLFLAGYAVLPWQAMYAAFDGLPFGREDKPYIQWMQYIAIAAAKYVATKKTSNKGYWKITGVIYGFLRSLPMIPAVLAIWYYTGSVTALLGLLFVSEGIIYYLSGVFTRKTRFIVMNAELAIGFLIGVYLVVI